MTVLRQGYYAWINRKPSQRELKHQFLEGEIERVFKEHKGRYGSPRITLQLYEEGIETNKRVVAVLMRKMGLCAKGYHRRKASYGLSKNIETAVKENLLNREFNQETIDTIWVTDITYISCSDGRLYLSTYIDLTTRIPRCFAIEVHMKKEIVMQPLKDYRGILPKMIHSDNGAEFINTSAISKELSQFELTLEKLGIKHVRTQPYSPWQNGKVERSHRLDNDRIYSSAIFKSEKHIKKRVSRYNSRYNNIHTKVLGFMSPNEMVLKYKYVSIALT